MRHGHTLKLAPDPALLAPVASPRRAGLAGFVEPTQLPAVASAIAAIAPRTIADRVDVYSGATTLSDGRRIKSRHLAHADNALAVQAIAAELALVGGDAIDISLHRFSHRGRELSNVEGEIAGSGAEAVLVTAHLDSTGANSPDFDEQQDAAPGADDDASGVAAVLSIAEAFAKLAAGGLRPARTVRFVLFNAEEEGRAGSRAYARLQRARQADIVAVLQMDMVGYNKLPPRTWEVHAGFATDAAVERNSLELAHLLGAVMRAVSPDLAPPQIYGTTAQGSDPADGRSDHTPSRLSGGRRVGRFLRWSRPFVPRRGRQSSLP